MDVSKKSSSAAERLSTEFPCLWLRGILPSQFTDIDPQYVPPNTVKYTYINHTSTSIVWASGTYYGDASGGEFSSFAPIRRAGCGLAAISDDGTLRFGVSFNLPGTVQTVPRGELYALVALVLFASQGSTLDYVTDNKGLYNTYTQGPKFALQTTNCDLYNMLYKAIYDKALLVEVRWMPSHLLENPTKGVYSGVSYLDLLGNSHADKLADQAAIRFSVPINVSTKYLYYIHLTKRIQFRITTILLNLPDRPKYKKIAEQRDTVGLSTL